MYIQQECHSVLKLHPITFYWTVFLVSVRFLGWMPLFVFFGLPIVSCSLIKKSYNRMLVTFGICFKRHFDTRYLVFYNPSPPRCFYPWTFFQNIGFNMVPSDPFISHLATQLGYSATDCSLYFDICNDICRDTSCHFRLYLSFLNVVLYYFKYSCTNIFHRRSLYTFYESKCQNMPAY